MNSSASGESRDTDARLAALEAENWALRAGQADLRRLLDAVDSIVWDFDLSTWQFTFVSAQAERILGYPMERWNGGYDFWKSLIHPEDRTWAVEFCERMSAAGQDHDFDYRLLAADGRVVWIHDRVRVVMEGGKPVRLNGIMADISERKRAEEERRQFEARLLQAQKFESLGVLAGGMAHEFNNQMTAVLGYADLAAEQLPAESPLVPMLEHVGRAARRVADLTAQMLAYSGKGRLVVQRMDLSALVRGMAQLLETVVSAKAVLTLDCADGLPPVEGDPSQLRQVVMNLLTNASDALGERGTIAVRTGAEHLDGLALQSPHAAADLAPGRYVRLEVADSGCGMDAAMQGRIFDPFFSTKFTGRGLGLAAVLGIVRGHQGLMKVTSAPGAGTIFRVWFPAAS